MRRNAAAGRRLRSQGGAALEQQQHAFGADIEGEQRPGLKEWFEAEPVFVEGASPFEVVDIERGFDDALQAGHGGPPRFSGSDQPIPAGPATGRRAIGDKLDFARSRQG